MMNIQRVIIPVISGAGGVIASRKRRKSKPKKIDKKCPKCGEQLWDIGKLFYKCRSCGKKVWW